MAAISRDLKSFASNNGAETVRVSRSAECTAVTVPVEAISDGESAHASMPFGKYTSSEVLAMWKETLKQLNFEEKLKSFYESLVSGLEERHRLTQEKLEQQNQLMQALMCEVCDRISECFAPPQASGQPPMRPSFRPRHQLYEDPEEITSAHAPDVLLVSTESQFIASGIQIGGEPTCAVFVSRSDHERTIELLKCEAIRNLSCHVESSQSIIDENVQNIRSENNQRLFSNGATNVGLEDDKNLGTAATGHGDSLFDHDAQDSEKEEEVKVKPSFWNRVLDRKGDADLMMMPVKEVRMLQQQLQQLKCEIIELKGTLKEKESLLAEKERMIEMLESFRSETSGYVQSGQGHLSGMLAHCDNLTTKIPKAPTTASVGVGNPAAVWPKQPEEDDKVEEKMFVKPPQFSEVNLHNMENNASPTLEAANPIIEEDHTPKKPPSKINPERKFANKPETKTHTSKCDLKTAKNTNLHDEPVTTHSVEKPFIADKSEKLVSDDDLKPHDLKSSSQQTKCDTLPTNKPKPHNHADNPIDNKLGTPVDP